ncbi:CPBP family intramembrane metalloprotease [Paenibacillus alvei]|uniref:CPBP family intramembrane metalloprotease n=1 Tax=Paenibacillus alvei TaxID=44250 RepID=A0ABT4EIF6_PAEAL|nr:CPBP family intramembrane glutamic endopeptidase [Paenibacillus alvei]MCY9532146.1 CPBP family intramembrane metalloprotease [Paenibacillus alvei]
MTVFYERLKNFFNLQDPDYVDFLRKYEAKGKKQITFYLMLALIPGVLTYILIYFFREPFMELTGLSSHNTQFFILAIMASVWHVFFPFAMLRYADKLSFKESLRYLGFTRLDLKGLIIVFPVIVILFTLISLPYMRFIFPPLHEYLNSLPYFHMGEWHIWQQGYYDFPWYLLMIGVFGNFVGEEIYFRGYLLRKVGSLKFDWLIIAVLFQIYHMWQAPQNWAFIPLSIFIPEEILVKLRKNIYGAILLHLFVNTIWGIITFKLVGV